jgi:hypothetical protein
LHQWASFIGLTNRWLSKVQKSVVPMPRSV